VVCSLETSSQLARPGVNCSLSGDVLTPLPLMSTVKTEDSMFGLLEEDTGFAVCFTTQLSLVVRLLQEYRNCKSSALATQKTNSRPHAHISCPAFCTCCPCHFALTCCIGLGRYLGILPRLLGQSLSDRTYRCRAHGTAASMKLYVHRAHRRLANHRTAGQKKPVLKVHAEAIYCTARAFYMLLYFSKK